MKVLVYMAGWLSLSAYGTSDECRFDSVSARSVARPHVIGASLSPLLEASHKAVTTKRPFGVEIEFTGNPRLIAEAVAGAYGGTVDTRAEIDRIQTGTMEKYVTEGKGWVRIQHEPPPWGGYTLSYGSASPERPVSYRPRHFPTLEEARREARSALPAVMNEPPVESAVYFYAHEKEVGHGHKPHRFVWEADRMRGPEGWEGPMTLEEARAFMDKVRSGDHPIESKQVIRVRDSAFGDVIVKPENDGLWELATDHTRYQTPEAFSGLLQTLYQAGARGTGEDTPVGIHVNVSAGVHQVPQIARNWMHFEKAIREWSQPHPERHKYIRSAAHQYQPIFERGVSGERFVQELLETSRTGRESDLNLFELAEGKKPVAEVRIFNTGQPKDLPQAIRLSLGLVELTSPPAKRGQSTFGTKR